MKMDPDLGGFEADMFLNFKSSEAIKKSEINSTKDSYSAHVKISRLVHRARQRKRKKNSSMRFSTVSSILTLPSRLL